MYINKQPYTTFRGVNLRDGKLRLADKDISTTDYAVELKVAPGTYTGERKVYLKDASGSMFVQGYHITYGSSSFLANGNIAIDTIASSSASITGVLTSSVILINAATSAEVEGFIPFGATCQTAGKVIIQYLVATATAAITAIPFNYVILHPQTS